MPPADYRNIGFRSWFSAMKASYPAPSALAHPRGGARSWGRAPAWGSVAVVGRNQRAEKGRGRAFAWEIAAGEMRPEGEAPP